MPYSLLYTIQLGGLKAGLSLKADLLDQSDTMVASGISTNFTHLGFGNYKWYYTNFPNSFRGYAKIYDSANPSGWNLPIAINPEDLSEYTGSNVVTIDVEESDGDPIGGAKLEIYPSGLTTGIVGLGYSNTSTGKATFNLDNGDYDVYTSKTSLYSFSNPKRISVSSSSTSFATVGTPFTVPSVPDGDLVRVYTFVNDLGLEPRQNVKMLVSPSGLIDIDEEIIIAKQGLSANSDANGYVYLDVAANIPIRVKIPDANFDKYVMSPSAGTLNLAEIID